MEFKLRPPSYGSYEVTKTNQKEKDARYLRDEWSKFIQHTTFHGVRFIFEHESNIFRKLLWVVCVVAAFVLFFLNVGLRIRAYFDYATSVDVEILYNKSLLFPHVTICNLNTYRMTKASEFELFQFLEDYYSSNASSASNVVTEYEHILSKVNPSEFIKTTSHQMDDLIYRCSWQGQPCNMEEHFKPVVTNLGLCYTFTGGSHVTKQGSKQGLSLVLNVEQYEYMKGPQDDAGVKIQLHNPTEPPLMEDYGFVVAPGTHTLATIDLKHVTDEPHPYGECVVDAPHRSACTLECSYQQHMELCQCADLYMLPGTGNCKLCSLPKLYKCKTIPAPTNCNCSVPCHRVFHEPSLSYAQLSRYNIERLARGHPEKKQRLQSSFLHARESGQRVVREYVNSNEHLISSVVQSQAVLQKTVDHALEIMSSSSQLASNLQIVDVIENGAEMLLATRTMINNELQKQNRLLKNYGMKMHIHREHFMQVLRSASLALRKGVLLFAGYRYNNEPNTIIRMVNNCSFTSTHQDPREMRRLYDYGIVDDHPCRKGSNAYNNCSCLYFNMYTPVARDLTGAVLVLNTLLPGYNTTLSSLWEGNLDRLNQFPEHEVCLNRLMQFTNQFLPVAKTIGLRYASTYNANSKGAMESLLNLAKVYINNRDLIDNIDRWDELKSQCTWMLNFSNTQIVNVPWPSLSDTGERQRVETFNSGITSAIESFPTLQAGFQSMVSAFHDLGAANARVNQALVEPLASFHSGSFTKHETAKKLTLPSLSEKVSQHQSAVESVIDEVMNYKEILVTSFGLNLKTAFQNLGNLTIPVLNPRLTKELGLWHQLVLKSNNSVLAGFERSGTSEEPLQELVLLVVELLQAIPSNVSSSVEAINQILKDSIEDLDIDLQDYIHENKINHQFYMENFLRVDIFYKELSYTKVVQAPSFGLLSLLGEIGGFLGLLLGASVLTVIELVDYIALRIAAKVKNRKTDKSANQYT